MIALQGAYSTSYFRIGLVIDFAFGLGSGTNEPWTVEEVESPVAVGPASVLVFAFDLGLVVPLTILRPYGGIRIGGVVVFANATTPDGTEFNVRATNAGAAVIWGMEVQPAEKGLVFGVEGMIAPSSSSANPLPRVGVVGRIGLGL